jgi:uncharacterized protein
LERFVAPFYEPKDIMHDLSHIRRILKVAMKIAEPYQSEIDQEVLIYGAYFHGIIKHFQENIIRFLQLQNISQEKMAHILEAARGSLKKEVPESLEAKILHDAHLLEGGRPFQLIKSMITGSLRGQTLEETISILENRILGKYRCYLPENRQLFQEREEFTRKILDEMKPYL